jgi:hypothetical protein
MARRFRDILGDLFFRFLGFMGAIKYQNVQQLPQQLSSAVLGQGLVSPSLLGSLAASEANLFGAGEHAIATESAANTSYNIAAANRLSQTLGALPAEAMQARMFPSQLAYQQAQAATAQAGVAPAQAAAKTALSQQAIAQNYLQQIQSGKGSGVLSIGPGGSVTVSPWMTKAAIDTGQAGGIVGGRPQGTVTATGTDNNPPAQPPQTNPNVPQTPGQQAASQIGAGSEILQSGQAPAMDQSLRNAITAPTSAVTAPTGPVAVDSTLPNLADRLTWYQNNVDSRAVDARVEMGQNGLPTGRTIMMHDPKSGIPPQPVHPAWFAQGAQNPALASGITSSPFAVAAASPAAQQILQNIAAGAPTPAILPSAPSAPVLNGNGNAPLAIPSSPAATTALINQVGSPLMAGNNPQAGVRADIAPRAQLVAPSVVPRAQLVAPPAPTVTPVASPTLPREPAHPGFGPSPNTPEFWLDNTGSANPADFGKRVTNPDFVVKSGYGDPTAGGWQDPWYDVRGQDGAVHRVYVDPQRDGGRMSLASEYLVSGRVSDLSEHRDYLDGTSIDIKNPAREAEVNQQIALVNRWGTSGGRSYFETPRPQWEGFYKQALQFENQKPLPDDEKDHMLNLDKVYGLLINQQQLLDGMKPETHNQIAQFANNYAAKFGTLTPGWLENAAKWATGGKYDFSKPNPQLTQLLQNHNDIISAVRNMTSSPRYNEKGEEHLDTMVGDPSRSDYAQQLDNFLRTYIAPDAGRFTDAALADHYVIPKDFFRRQEAMQYGPGNVPGGSAQLPIILQNKAMEAKIAKGQWVVDKYGVPWQWQGD